MNAKNKIVAGIAKFSENTRGEVLINTSCDLYPTGESLLTSYIVTQICWSSGYRP